MKNTQKKQTIIGLKEFRLNAEKYIALVDKGASFTVVKRSVPVFTITPVDDEPMWERVIDFTAIRPQGVSARDVLKAIKAVHG